MKTALVILLGFLSLNIQAQNRSQILQDLRSWSDSVRDETYNSQANIQDLQRAQDLLEQAHSLISGSRSGSDVLCARTTFGYQPVNTASGLNYGDSVPSLNECQRMLPARGARALCTKARFGYQPMTIDRAQYVGESSFSTLDDCLYLAPQVGQSVMCARSRFGYRPYSLLNLLGLGDEVTTADDCKSLLPQRGSALMCIKVNFGYQAINLNSGRAFGQRTATLAQCHQIINQGGVR